MRKSTIYTRKGDGGMSCLADLQPRKKSDPTFACLGSLDELNARIGAAVCTILTEEKTYFNAEVLIRIQHVLFKIGSIVALPRAPDETVEEYSQKMAKRKLIMNDDDVTVAKLEKLIDAMDETCEPLRNFILPGGSRLACDFHLCRTQCREAERLLVAYADEYELQSTILSLINRLSDFFFVAARHANAKAGVLDVIHFS